MFMHVCYRNPSAGGDENKKQNKRCTRCGLASPCYMQSLATQSSNELLAFCAHPSDVSPSFQFSILFCSRVSRALCGPTGGKKSRKEEEDPSIQDSFSSSFSAPVRIVYIIIIIMIIVRAAAVVTAQSVLERDFILAIVLR